MSVQEEMIDHALESFPNECCGLLVGKGDQIEVIPLRNTEASPYCFLMDYRELLEVYLAMDKRGQELQAIYHSHPYGRAYPSPSDLILAAWPICILVGMESGKDPEIKVFRIEDQAVTDEMEWLW